MTKTKYSFIIFTVRYILCERRIDLADNIQNRESGNERTKRQFADAILNLSEFMPLQKIRVADICEKCGLKRQSFYYHFKDKYDLIAWMFVREFDTVAAEQKVLNSEEMIFQMNKRIEKHKKFYKAAYLDTSQNSLSDYMVRMYIDMEEKALCEYLHTDTLDAELMYDIKCYSYACIIHSKYWLTDEEKMTAEYFAKQMYRTMPELLKKAFESQAKSV